MAASSERPPRPRGLWHEGFYALMSERGPAGFEQLTEHALSQKPRRADMLLIRRTSGARAGEARVLRDMWPRLGPITLLEFKSPSRGFRRGELMRLASYGAQYCEDGWESLGHASALTLVLVVSRINRALLDELAFTSWDMDPVDGGYARIRGPVYTMYVVVTNEVAEAEDDDLLRIFSERDVRSLQAWRWLEQFFLEKQTMPELREREGYDELLQKLLGSLPAEDVLARYKPEERLRGLGPEERLRGLEPEEAVLALPVEVLRGLSEDYIRTLPEHVQRAVRERLAR